MKHKYPQAKLNRLQAEVKIKQINVYTLNNLNGTRLDYTLYRGPQWMYLSSDWKLVEFTSSQAEKKCQSPALMEQDLSRW